MANEIPLTLHLRRRREPDCETVVSWIDDAAALYFFTGPRIRWPIEAADLVQMGEGQGFCAWVLVDDATGDVVGHFDLTVDAGVARLGRVIVDPRRRGRRLSRTLVDHAIAVARQCDASKLSLTVIAGNEPAIRTYERAGFCLSGAGRPDAHAMTLSLERYAAPEQ